MKNTIRILITIQIILTMVGCSAKNKNIIEKPTILSDLKKELNLENYQLDSSLSKDSKKYIKINFPNETFNKGSSLPIGVTYKLEKITNILKKFPTIIIQINTYSNDLTKEEENINLANNRAFNIAEILDSFQIKNEIFAKGYQIKKNKKLEIFLYDNIKDMSDHAN